MYVKRSAERAKVYGPDAKLLTAEIIHKEFLALGGAERPWDELRPVEQEAYQRVASRLRVFLEAESPESM